MSESPALWLLSRQMFVQKNPGKQDYFYYWRVYFLLLFFQKEKKELWEFGLRNLSVKSKGFHIFYIFYMHTNN